MNSVNIHQVSVILFYKIKSDQYNIVAIVQLYILLVNVRRACARGLQYFVCLFVTSLLISFHVCMTN